ncbi:MAG: glycosyltransferase family 4 protein [Candidatus Jordarchaeaceae archaeon]
MKVLMFGWEFPPMSSGGLGTACYGLTRSLSNLGVEITFVMPYAAENPEAEDIRIIATNNPGRLKIVGINSALRAYITSSQYRSALRYTRNPKEKILYGEDLFQEVERFSKKAAQLAEKEEFDVIHCHDWMTFKAGIKAKRASGKPLIVHVHATEFDRTGGNAHPIVYDIERRGLHEADRIIAVSQFTKNKIVQYYGVHPDKVTVVYNAVDLNDARFENNFKINKRDKIVLFLGRLTLQKGPDYFVEAAKKCLEFDSNIKFIIAGTGSMEWRLIERVAELGIADKVLFAGFVTDEEREMLYQMADVYVMPSVSEPFGMTPLEALKYGTPVIISKQSGVSEVLKHCLKVDFWDINQLVDKILGVLRYKELKHTLREHGSLEVRKFDWNQSARKCIEVYNEVLRGMG